MLYVYRYVHILKTPCFCSLRMGQLSATFKASPKTCLVCCGKMTPSSQSLAEAQVEWLSRWQSYRICCFNCWLTWGSTCLPCFFSAASFTCTSTPAAYSPPMTDILLYGQVKRKLGENALPHMPQLPAPKDPPNKRVNLGTQVVETACTSLAPCLAIPSCSYFLPIMNPVMFYRNNKGIFLQLHNSMKWVALRAASENNTPLLATMPTYSPYNLLNPHTIVSPQPSLNS